MENKSKITLGHIADICGIVALPLALGLAFWLVGGIALFIAGLLARPHIDAWLRK